MSPPAVDHLFVRGDHGRIVIGAITRIIGCLAIIVVLFHDGVSLGVAQVTTDQDSQVAARAGAQAYKQAVTSHGATVKTAETGVQTRYRADDVQKAYEAAALSVASKGTDIDAATFKVDNDGQVTVTATRRTSTMVADRLGWFDKLTHPTATSSAVLAPDER